VPPRQATPRDPSRTTDGAAGAFIAHLHGRPWTPWQRFAADLIGERLPNGRYAWPVVVIQVPRQTGKTTFAFDLMQGRCLEHPDYRVAYCAQTGHVTTERFTERMTELTGNPLGRRVRCRRSQGTERMSFPRGSFVKAFPPKDGALRGSALDLVVVDEPQEIDEELGVALDQTILPTFTTRPRRQLILIGTAGDARSAYLARYLALARGAADGVALIEYGADEADDPADPAVWARVHPGLAADLTDTDALRSALNVMGPAGFAREYLNVWQAAGDRLIPAAAWADIRRRDARPAPGVAPVLGVDVALDRSAAAVVACWPDTDGVPVLEVVDYRPQVDWVAGRLLELVDRHRPVVWADNAGPVLTVVDDLQRAADAARVRVVVERTPTPDYTAACAGLLDRITGRAVLHRGDPALDAAAAGAARRGIGDGAWGWGRRSSTADISPLVAGTLALWGHQHRPAPPVRPAVYAL
jgi:hypothetical protein